MPEPKAFDNLWMVNHDGKLYSQYPPGYSLFLAPFILMGNVWLATPTLLFCSVIALFYLAKEVGSKQTAYLAVVLMLFSYLTYFITLDILSHSLALLLTLCCVLFYIKLHKTECVKQGLLAVVFMGLLFNTRPQVAVPIAVPLILHWIFFSKDGFRKKQEVAFKKETLFFCAFLPFFGFFLFYNYVTTGDILLTPYEKRAHPGVVPGEHFFNYLSWESVLYHVRRVLAQVYLVNKELFNLVIPSLAGVWAFFQLRLEGHYIRLLLGVSLSVTLSLLLTPYDGLVFRPRYLFEIFGFLFIVTAYVLTELPDLVRKQLKIKKKDREYPVGVISFFFIALIIGSFPNSYKILQRMEKWELRPHERVFIEKVQEEVQTPALILIRDDHKNYPIATQLYNPPRMDKPILIARKSGFSTPEAIDQYFGDRYIYAFKEGKRKLMRPPLERFKR